MIKVYIAGPMRSKSPVEFLFNLRRGIAMGAQLIVEGFAPFCPMLDSQYFFQDPHIPLQNVMEVSLEWLTKSDVMLVLPGWEESEGTKVELMVARKCNIPVFFSLQLMKEHFR